MYFKLNKTTVPNLQDTEKLLIWSIREWIISIMRAKDPRPEIIKCFSKILIQEAVMPFDKMMRTISYNCCVPIDVRCHCSNLLGRTEIDILFLISAIQNKLQVDLRKVIKVSNENNHLEMINSASRPPNTSLLDRISLPPWERATSAAIGKPKPTPDP